MSIHPALLALLPFLSSPPFLIPLEGKYNKLKERKLRNLMKKDICRVSHEASKRARWAWARARELKT